MKLTNTNMKNVGQIYDDDDDTVIINPDFSDYIP